MNLQRLIPILALTAIIAALALPAFAAELPPESDRDPVAFPHFPTPAHTFVWRNWQLVPIEKMAAVINATPNDIRRMGNAMGLTEPAPITEDQRRRSYITVIRRNWHLLPYTQLTQLLDMTEERLAFTLREDDFLYVKLGNLKPRCEPIQFEPPNDAILAREREIAAIMQTHFPDGPDRMNEPLFQFVADLSAPPPDLPEPPDIALTPRFCSSYFALFGDPLLEEDIDPYPDGLLQRLAASGVDAIWMHIVLYQLAPFPWDASLSEHHEKRLARLKTLTERLDQHGIGLYLYLNEPRAMPLAFFNDRGHLRGVTEGDHAALCTTVPEVRQYLIDSVASICRAAPLLRGFFTITASENLTNCWSHHRGMDCPSCKDRPAAEVIADVNAAVADGIETAGTKTDLIAWDWGWQDDWAVDAINRLPDRAAHMSVSEWSIPITRGGIDTVVGEYSISTIGPGPRATKHWQAARDRGLRTIAKIQAGNTWELAAVPYIPALANVAQHAANLRDAHIDGIMLGWSLGGYPSPNLEVVAAMNANASITPQEAMRNVAARRYGGENADAVVNAWNTCSKAFSEFPYSGATVYNAPIQVGPANLLWAQPTGYSATMVGIPYDNLDGWRGPYPPEIFAAQFNKIADGFDAAFKQLTESITKMPSNPSQPGATARAITDSKPNPTIKAVERELSIIGAAAAHFRSVANQTQFLQLRNQLESAAESDREAITEQQNIILQNERDLAKKLHTIQTRDSRIGYEASNHYFYTPLDLAEKVLNCEHLLQSDPKT